MFIIFMLLGGPANLRQQLKDFTGWNILQISIRAGEGERETAENGFFRGSKSVFGFFFGQSIIQAHLLESCIEKKFLSKVSPSRVFFCISEPTSPQYIINLMTK